MIASVFLRRTESAVKKRQPQALSSSRPAPRSPASRRYPPPTALRSRACRGQPACHSQLSSCLGERRCLWRKERRRNADCWARTGRMQKPQNQEQTPHFTTRLMLASPRCQVCFARCGTAESHCEECRVWHAKIIRAPTSASSFENLCLASVFLMRACDSILLPYTFFMSARFISLTNRSAARVGLEFALHRSPPASTGSRCPATLDDPANIHRLDPITRSYGRTIVSPCAFSSISGRPNSLPAPPTFQASQSKCSSRTIVGRSSKSPGGSRAHRRGCAYPWPSQNSNPHSLQYFQRRDQHRYLPKTQ